MVELRTLGNCQIVVGRERIGPQSPYAFALALYLAIERGRPHSRDQLLPIFFPGVPEPNAAHSLRQNLYKLRQLGVPAETTPAGTMIAATAVRDDYSVLLATSELPDPHAERLPGEFLPGYWPKISDEYTRWLDSQRDAVNSALRRAYVSRILDRRAVARWDEVERFARACLAIDPLNEEATLGLAEALALSGSKAAGVKVLEAYLNEVTPLDPKLSLPATLLRKRIGERLSSQPSLSSRGPLVGRERELLALSAMIADTQAGLQRTALIWGESGIGKTRLVRDFSALLYLNGAKLIEVSAQPHDLRRPMSLLVDLAPVLLRSAGALGADPLSIDLLKGLFTIGPEGHSPCLIGPGVSADETSSVLTDAFSDVIDAISSEHALVLQIEDLHWADTASRRVIANILAESKQRRLLTLVTSRDSLTGLTVNGSASLFHLKGLDDHNGRQLIANILAAHAHPPASDIADRIYSLSGGNPFYLRELCTYWMAVGSLDRTPPVLRDLVSQRLSALDATSRTALAMCAVLGKLATVSRVEAALELPTHALASALADLEALSLIDQREGRLHIQHELVASCLFETESSSRLAVVRRAAASILESDAQHSGAITLFWDSADHWTHCGEPDRAKHALQRCALHAAKVGAAHESLEAVARFATVASESEASELCDTIRAMVLREAQDRTIVDSWRTAPSSRQNSAFAKEFELLTYEVSRHYSGDTEQHVAELERTVADSSQDRKSRIRAASIAMCVADDIDDAMLARRLITQVAVRPEEQLRADPDLLRLLLVYHTGFGDRKEAQRIAHTIACWPDGKFQEGESVRSLINAALAIGYCGKLSLAGDLLDRAFGLCEGGIPSLALVAAAHRYWFARQLGDEPAARQWVDAVRSISNTGLNVPGTMGLYILTLDALDTGDLPMAGSCLQSLESGVAFYSKSSHWAMYEAARLRHGVLSNAPTAAETDLQAISAWSLRTAPRAPEDDVAFGVALHLMERDRQTSLLFIDAYLRVRRPGLPILPRLNQLAEMS